MNYLKELIIEQLRNAGTASSTDTSYPAPVRAFAHPLLSKSHTKFNKDGEQFSLDF